MWSSKNPVTLLGADATKQGAEEVRRFFEVVASWSSNCIAYRFELVAAEVSGDLAYTVGFEHISVSFRAARWRRSASASRTSTGERTVSGGSFTATVTGFWTTRLDLRGITGCDGTNPTASSLTLNDAK